MSAPTAADPLCTEPEGAEKRATVRFVCGLNGDCRPADPLDAGNMWPARATDLSRGGISLRMCRRFEPGTIIALQFTSFPAEGAFMPLAKVCHVRREGMQWQIGCIWSRELTGDELRSLVGRTDVLRKAAA